MQKLISLLISLVIFTYIPAQESGGYFYFNLGSGHHNLSYEPQNGMMTAKIGCTANLAFSCFFTPTVGFQTGIGVQSFNALSTLNLTESTTAIDSDGDQYVFKSNFINWQENQQVLFLDIPLTGQFRKLLNSNLGLLATVGAKISIPLSSTYRTTGGEIVTSGYYSQWNVELTDMPQHGFTTITQSYTGKYSLKPTYMAIAEFGGIYKISEKIDLYAGAYFNYGLNNVLKADTKMLLMLDKTYNGVWSSYQITSIQPFSVGVKLGLYLRPVKK